VFLLEKIRPSISRSILAGRTRASSRARSAIFTAGRSSVSLASQHTRRFQNQRARSEATLCALIANARAFNRAKSRGRKSHAESTMRGPRSVTRRKYLRRERVAGVGRVIDRRSRRRAADTSELVIRPRAGEISRFARARHPGAPNISSAFPAGVNPPAQRGFAGREEMRACRGGKVKRTTTKRK